jgi:hypothetical protein
MGDGGVCCAGSTCEPSDPESCAQIGGDYKSSAPSGACFVTRIILDYLDEEHAHDSVVRQMAGGTYSLLYDARDQVLMKCTIGQKCLEHYRKYGPELLELTRKDWELRRHVLFTFFKLASFSRVLLRYLWISNAEFKSTVRYTSSLHKELFALICRLDASGMSSDGIRDLRRVLDDVQVFIDHTVPEIASMMGLGRTS